MMFENDRLCCFSRKPAKLRVFLFPLPISNNKASFNSLASTINLKQLSVDSLNISIHVPTTTPPPPPSTMSQIEFLKTSPGFATKDMVTKK
ncbi:hypothetical protein MtrunA17_Chr5g0440701 [Medicago truncatula]|nr:hypothetical protein MtrunA17_Chr5g0440701 [Medicago truncatula]